MMTETGIPQQWTPDDFFRVFELHARYVQIIEPYVRHRVPDQETADRVMAAVFHAAVEAQEIPDPALPWLIAVARRECARARRLSTTG